MESSVGALGTLPLEKICDIVAQLRRVRDLVALMNTSSVIRGVVLECLRGAVLTLEEEIPASLLTSLPISRVQTLIRVSSASEVETMSRQVRGSLFLIGGTSTRLVGWEVALAEWASHFNPQEQYLQALTVRSQLYPASPFRALNIVQDNEGVPELRETAEEVFLPISWDPRDRRLELDLLLRDQNREKIRSWVMNIFSRLPIQSLYMRSRASEYIDVPSLEVPASHLELTKFTVGKHEGYLVLGYISDRQSRGLPLYLQTIELLPAFGYLTMDSFLRSVSREGIQLVPSVTEIIGLETTMPNFRRLLRIFPNIQRATIRTTSTGLARLTREYPRIAFTVLP